MTTKPREIVSEDKSQRRRPWWRRIHTDATFRNGRLEISKVAEIAGYAIVVCLLWRYAERLLDNPFALSLLVSCLLFPSLVKKIAGKMSK